MSFGSKDLWMLDEAAFRDIINRADHVATTSTIVVRLVDRRTVCAEDRHSFTR